MGKLSASLTQGGISAKASGGGRLVSSLIRAGVAARHADSKVWLDWNGKPHDRTKFVSASMVGKCARMQKFGKVYPELDTLSSHGYSERGHSIEAWAVEQLRAAGVELIAAGEDQRTVHDQYQSGTPDGILRVSGQHVLWECKSIDPRASIYKLPKPEHVMQVIQNIDLSNHCYDLDIDLGVITYINASNFDEVHEYHVKFDPNVADYLQKRAEIIMSAEGPEALPAEGMADGSCSTCSFKDKCSAAVQYEVNKTNQQKGQADAAKRLFK